MCEIIGSLHGLLVITDPSLLVCVSYMLQVQMVVNVLLGDGFECFESLDSFEKVSFVLGSELWEDDFSSMLDACC